MAKKLKLNLKNLQISETIKSLNKKGTSAPKKTKTTKKAKVEEVKKEEKPKRKARLLPSIEEEKKKAKILEEKKKEKEQEKKKAEELKQAKEAEAKKELQAKEEKPKAKPKSKGKITADFRKPEIIKQPEEKKEEIKKAKPKTKISEEKKQAVPSTPTKPKPEKKTHKIIEEVAEEKKKVFKSYKDFKAAKKPEAHKTFDTRDRLGLRSDEERWRKRRAFKAKKQKKEEIPVIRPSNLKVRLPITIKDLAALMKLKASELIQKLFMQGIILTLNDYLEDETTVQLLGHEFKCDIQIDTEEEKRLQITEHSIQEEIQSTNTDNLIQRPPIITFMGHVDHGKTSLIDAIRKSNITASEAGQITQHIGAFIAKTSFGNVTILDTPGHAAFSEMRLRGATVTDIVVLVIAGDEGIRDQTIEALNQAKQANVPIVVALNKADKAGFDQEKVYRQLADQELLPEAWGGTTITVNCSAQTKQGIPELLEMLSLQAEILELKANPKTRARGTTLESEMHKGLGAVATVLVQNGTLKPGNAIVFGEQYGRIKTMHDQFGKQIFEAGPSVPVKITGLSALSEAGCEFICVENEKQAKDLAEKRREKIKLTQLQQPKIFSLESMAKKAKKILNIILRADVQGSLEALKASLLKIETDKVILNVVSSEVGEISESDVRLAAASEAVILGFHTNIESHAEPLIKHLKVIVREHDIIYHAIDEVKELMRSTLDKITEEHDTGQAKVIALFKSSQLGKIAGCLVTDGIIKRNSNIKIIRNDEIIHTGKISSLKRVKEDVKEVKKDIECGILFENFTDIQKDDIIQAYDIKYLEQDL